MATVFLAQPTDMSTALSWSGYVAAATPSQIIISDNVSTGIFGGLFSYVGLGVYGTATSYLQLGDGTLEFALDDLAVDAHATQLALEDGGLAAAFDFALSGDDVLIGSTGDDVIEGFGGEDSIHAAAGDDTIDGGAGLDTAFYAGCVSEYAIMRDASSTVVADNTANRDGRDLLVDVERMHFSDVTLAFDIAGAAGEGLRIYKAVFNRTPDQDGLTYWVHNLDKGMSLKAVAQAFVESTEFASIYGKNPSADDVVAGFYSNVLGRAPDTAGLDYWVEVFKAGMSPADLLINFSESAENQRNTVALVANGIPLTNELLGQV